ncbi:MAG: hypothetical protein GKR94_03885 [Gammaproteobacteria bacterium]|nr:hypothetical protein [Gammaproteobacteria bacterium]
MVMIKRLEISWGWRLPCAVLGAMLLWAAVMQSNDPDPLLWIAVYGLHGAIGLCAAVGWVAPWPALIASLLTLLWAATLWPAVVVLLFEHDPEQLLSGMSPDRPYVEEAREALGLTLAFLASAYTVAISFLVRPAVHH